jgi:starch synthase
MYIVMIASECAPISKVGGLADVVDGLSRELKLRGHGVEIILPKYDCMQTKFISHLSVYLESLKVPCYDQLINCTAYAGVVHGNNCIFIEPHSDKKYFNRGVFYGQSDDAERFAFFSRAALEFLVKTNKNPDIIHCHDWQTGIVPVLVKDLKMTDARTCFTLHNIKHQGLCGEDVLKVAGLNPSEYMRKDRLLDDANPDYFNLMKGGVVYADYVNTVSPRYSDEVRDTGQGFGLQDTIRTKGDRYGGVLNGVDYEDWNPETDKFIPSHYGIDTVDDKFKNKDALRKKFMLKSDFKPIIASIGRLDAQKGVHLIRHSIFYALNNGCQFVLLGSSPETNVSEYFWHLKYYLDRNPDCHLELGFNEEYAHLIYAGADIIVVPSLFEPCGLTQLISLKYGTVPIVRKTGGLADTVFDVDQLDRPFHQRNGYVFEDYSYEGIEAALKRAVGLWYSYPEKFREVILNGMKYDYSWNNPGEQYIRIYEHIKAYS